MKRKILICLLVLGLGVGTATAQFGSGIVFDPTNYHNALLRYYQLQQHLIRTAEELRPDHQPTQPCPADGPVRQKHARSLPRDIFAMAKCDLAQHLREHRLVD